MALLGSGRPEAAVSNNPLRSTNSTCQRRLWSPL